MNKSLTRSIGFWLLLILSLVAAGVGGWLVAGQISSMTTTLLANTATGVDVYVGQSLVVVGAVLLGAGVIGIFIAVALTAVQSVLPSAAPVAVEAIDWTAQEPATAEALAAPVDETVAEDSGVAEGAVVETTDADERQNGSSGSTATATKISVK
ncbi:hypothetical protein [Microbacterium hydrocarbonoxydans]|uniref:hypothetical protein n=1 Tax=Microbacterium hydrocarbonoxydans TaxID=273678 RepID=UPI002041EF6A|nr:hypothetical protein [Microbacterium hydrocarbonoxydans]MCM3780569.1 hypothetical protein [Microbacterium hydrocarbonoxydans]